MVFGSDHGMCGQFNEQIASHTVKSLARLDNGQENRVLLAIGTRVASSLENVGLKVEEVFSSPGSVAGITPAVDELLAAVEKWRERLELDQAIMFYNEHTSNTGFVSQEVSVLPVDLAWLKRLQTKEWADRTIPTFTMDWDKLFSALIWQYLFVSVFRAVTESLASENAARLGAMERAEKNIQERLEELKLTYHQQRQMSITEELLEIVAGFETVAPKPKSTPFA